MQTAREGVYNLLLCLLQFSTKYPLILCNIRLCGIAVNHWRMAIENTVFFSGTGHGMWGITVERVLRVYPIPSRPTGGLRERRKLPRWVCSGAPAANDFWTFVRFYACVHYASIIPNRTSLEGSNSLQRQHNPCFLSAGVETMETGLRLGSYIFCRCHRHCYSIVEDYKMKN